jgi:hypothetical protein
MPRAADATMIKQVKQMFSLMLSPLHLRTTTATPAQVCQQLHKQAVMLTITPCCVPTFCCRACTPYAGAPAGGAARESRAILLANAAAV